MKISWMQRLIWSLSSNGWDSVIFSILLFGIVAWILIANLGCSTTQVVPRIGACLVDEKGEWYCKDPDSIAAPRSTTSRYVCLKLEEEWQPLMNFCKKKPTDK